jgi:drug/metabolite transporter (DMT)-like permease
VATREQQRGLDAHELATLLLLAAIWGASFLFIKVAVRDVGPLLLVTTRVVLATIAMLVYLLAVHGRMELRAMLRWVRIGDALILSLTGSTLPFLLISWAETRISSGLAGILNATTPLFTVVIALAIGAGMRLGWRFAGLLLGFAGATLVAWGDFAGSPLAIAAMIAAAPLYAVSALHARSRFVGLDPACVALVQVFTSSLLLVPVAAVLGRPQHSPGLDTIGSLLLLSLGGTAFAYVLYYRLLASAGPEHAVAVTYLVPIAAVIYGRLLLHEHIRLSALIGMAVIIVGEAISATPSRSDPPHVAAAAGDAHPP